MKKLLSILLIGVFVLLTACGGGGRADTGGISGTFVDESGTIIYVFEGNNISADFNGQAAAGTFEVDGNTLIITNEDGGVYETEFTLEDDVLLFNGLELFRQSE